MAQTGAARQWHISYLYNHERRFRDDLRLIESLAPSGPILEVGAAPCHLTALMRMSGYVTVGVDLDPHRIADFIRQFGLNVCQCDIERSALPFPDDTFASVLLCDVFEHLRIDPIFALSEICRVLAPGARLLLTTPNVYSLPSMTRFLLGRSIADPVEEYGKLRTLGHMGHVREYSTREVVRMLTISGLAVESIAYRHYSIARDWKHKLLHLAYRIAPRRFWREIVIVARKTGASPRLDPVVPFRIIAPKPPPAMVNL